MGAEVCVQSVGACGCPEVKRKGGGVRSRQRSRGVRRGEGRMTGDLFPPNEVPSVEELGLRRYPGK